MSARRFQLLVALLVLVGVATSLCPRLVWASDGCADLLPPGAPLTDASPFASSQPAVQTVSASALPARPASAPYTGPTGWMAVGVLLGIALSVGSMLGYQHFQTDTDTEWVDVPLVESGTPLDDARSTDDTFPMRIDALSTPLTVNDVVAIDEGDAVRCVATLQVVRFFT